MTLRACIDDMRAHIDDTIESFDVTNCVIAYHVHRSSYVRFTFSRDAHSRDACVSWLLVYANTMKP